MNSQLVGRVYNIPQNVMEFLRQQPEIPGLKRNKNLITTGQVNYGQLKRILHDLKKMDKFREPQKYNYYGGDDMLLWGMNTLRMERGQINNREASERIANDIAGLSGDRSNPTRKATTKNKFSPKIPMNDIVKAKSSGEKWAGASTFSAKSTKLFEEISRIKNLML